MNGRFLSSHVCNYFGLLKTVSLLLEKTVLEGMWKEAIIIWFEAFSWRG